MEIVIGVQFQDHQDPHSIDHRSIMQFASRLENNPRYLNKLSFLSDSEKLSKASHKSHNVGIFVQKPSFVFQNFWVGVLKFCKIYVKLSIISRNPKENLIHLNISDCSPDEMQSLSG